VPEQASDAVPGQAVSTALAVINRKDTMQLQACGTGVYPCCIIVLHIGERQLPSTRDTLEGK